MLPVAGHHIIVQGQPVHEAAEILPARIRLGVASLQHLLRPVVIVRVGAAADFLDGRGLVVMADVGLVPAVEVGVVLRRHVAAAPPVLVAYAEVVHPPGLLPAVPAAKLRHGGHAVEGHVLHPLGHLLHGAAAHIAVDVGLAAQLLAELEELVGAEAVVLHHPAPVGVHHPLAPLLRADAVLPVVLVRKASAGPAQHGNLQPFQRLHHIGAHAVLVGDMGVLPHEQPLIDASAQMLGEMSVNLRIDVSFFLLFIYI